MEGVGSRLGRASSRYGPAPVFSGPVRKWKKQWVHVSSIPSYSYRGNGNGNGNTNTPSLRLCRWTPIPSSADSDNSSGLPEETPRRKFRYTPVVDLEDNKEVKINKLVKGAKTSIDMTSATINSGHVFQKFKRDGVSMEEDQALNKGQLHSNKGHLELDLSLKGLDDDYNSDDENKEASLGRTSSGDLSRLG